MTYPHSVRRMTVFIIVWIGQLVSLLGSSLTNFALGVWVYEQTGSVTQFALISLFISLPLILIAPIAGAIVDRCNRRWIMILGDSGAGLNTLVIALLIATGSLEIWHIYLTTAISSTFSAFQRPAYSAAIAQLVSKQHLSRAGGMTQLGEAFAQLIAPMLAGMLLVTIKLKGIIAIDFATFLFALVTLLLVRFPNIKTSITQKSGLRGLLHQVVQGWTYLTDRPGLLGLLFLFTTANFLLGAVSVLVTPLVLSIASTPVLGIIMSVGGIGMVVGSITISIWGGAKKQINSVFGFMLLSGLCILAVGLNSSIVLFGFAAFLFFFSLPLIRVSSQVIFQKKVAVELQGRVFALNEAFVTASMPLAYVVAGPLADRVFEPLMAVNGPLAASIGQIIGVGSGRGISLMFVIIGFLFLFSTLVAYNYPRLRLVEEELPDALATE
ncbi:MAG: MFS transporter [Xenococcaceae cyanobacterium]